MNRRQLTIVIGTVVLLVFLSVNLAVQDRENTAAVSEPSNPEMFHSATWLPPSEPGGNRIRKLISPSRILYIDESILLERNIPRDMISLRLPAPTPLAYENNVSDQPQGQPFHFPYIEVFIRLDPEKRAWPSIDQFKSYLEKYREVEPHVDGKYQNLRIYSASKEKNRPGWYRSTDPSITTPNGDPIVFTCTVWGKEFGDSWGYCQGEYLIFGDMLVKIRFNSVHLQHWQKIFEKSFNILEIITKQPKLY